MLKLHQIFGTGLIAGATLVWNPGAAFAQHHGGGHASHASAHVAHASPHATHTNGHSAHVNVHPAHVNVTTHNNVVHANPHVSTVHAGTTWHGGTAWHNNSAWHGNYYNHDNHYGRAYPYNSFGLNYFPWWNSYYPGYSYYPPVDYGPTYSDSYYAGPEAYPDDYANDGPNAAGPAVPQTAVPTAAQLEVVVPTANAQVVIDGLLSKAQGTVRRFDSPPLEAGKTYAYHVSASWIQNGKPLQATKTVQIEAGKQFIVDFTGNGPRN